MPFEGPRFVAADGGYVRARRDALHDAIVDDDVLAEQVALVQHGLQRDVLAAGHAAEARAGDAAALVVEETRVQRLPGLRRRRYRHCQWPQ